MRESPELSENARRYAVLLAESGWLGVLDDIHGGFCHDLNGRVSSLDGLLQILQLDGPDDTPVVSYLEGESTRLADTVKLLRALSGKMDAPAEPHLAASVAERALALHRRHRGLEVQDLHLSAEDGVPPFRASLPRVLRVLLIVLSHAGRDAREANVRFIALDVATEAERPTLSVRWNVEGARWDPGSLQAVAGALGEILADDGGTLALEPGRAVLSFPALTLGAG